MAFYTDGKFVYQSGDLIGIPSFNSRGVPIGYFITNSYGRYVYDNYGRQLFSPASIQFIKPAIHTYHHPVHYSLPLPTPRITKPSFSSYIPPPSLSTPPLPNYPLPRVPPPSPIPLSTPKNKTTTDKFKDFYNESSFKVIIFKWLSEITNILYGEETKRLLGVETISANINNENSFLFFIKGGATPSLLLTYYKIKRVPIESDLDSILLINPKNKQFSKFINILTYQILKILKILISDNKVWPIFNKLYTKYTMKATISETLQYNTKSGIYANFLKYSDPITNFSKLLEPGYLKDCPFILEFTTNLTYAGKAFNIAKISVFTKTEPSINLIDISIPILAYDNYNFFWNTSGLVKYTGRQIGEKGNIINTHSFYVEDPISYIIDQLYTIKKDTWSNKNPKRLERVKTVKNIVKTIRERSKNNSFKNRIQTFKSKSNNKTFPSEITFNETLKNILDQ